MNIPAAIKNSLKKQLIPKGNTASFSIFAKLRFQFKNKVLQGFIFSRIIQHFILRECQYLTLADDCSYTFGLTLWHQNDATAHEELVVQ